MLNALASSPQPAEEPLRFMQRVWELSHALDVRSKRMAKTLGVTGPQRLVIRVLGQAPGSMASEVAATLKLHPSTLTGILARLEDQGLVVRKMDPADRRRARFDLTPRGSRIDVERKGTVEFAIRRVLVRSDASAVATTSDMLGRLAAELLR